MDIRPAFGRIGGKPQAASPDPSSAVQGFPARRVPSATIAGGTEK